MDESLLDEMEARFRAVLDERLEAWARAVAGRAPEELLPLKEAARRLGMKRTALGLRIRAGDIAVVRDRRGGHPRISTRELERYIAELAELNRVASREDGRSRPVSRSTSEGAKVRAALASQRRRSKRGG